MTMMMTMRMMRNKKKGDEIWNVKIDAKTPWFDHIHKRTSLNTTGTRYLDTNYLFQLAF